MYVWSLRAEQRVRTVGNEIKIIWQLTELIRHSYSYNVGWTALFFCCLWNQSTTCWHFKSISVLLCASSVSFVLLRCCCCCWLAAEHRNFNPFQLKIKSHFNTLSNTKSRSTSTWMNSLWSNEKWNFCFQAGIVLLFSNSISWLGWGSYKKYS